MGGGRGCGSEYFKVQMKRLAEIAGKILKLRSFWSVAIESMKSFLPWSVKFRLYEIVTAVSGLCLRSKMFQRLMAAIRKAFSPNETVRQLAWILETFFQRSIASFSAEALTARVCVPKTYPLM